MSLTSRGRVVETAIEKLPIKPDLQAKAADYANRYNFDDWAKGLAGITDSEGRQLIERAMASRAKESQWKTAYYAYLEGARAVLGTAMEEWLEENFVLQDQVMQLMSRFGVVPCPDCNTNSCDDMLTDCVRCKGEGWLPKE